MRDALLPHAAPADDRPREVSSNQGSQVPRAIRDRVLQTIGERVHFARKHWGKSFRMPEVDFSLRGRTAGTARASAWRISLNAVLLVENVDQMVRDTSVHELAHLLTAALHGSGAQAHGDEWKAVMRALGVEPSRTHAMDTLNSAVGELLYKYRCLCQETAFTPKSHLACRKKATYVCKKCKHTLVYTGAIRRAGVWGKDMRAGPLSQPIPFVRQPKRETASHPPLSEAFLASLRHTVTGTSARTAPLKAPLTPVRPPAPAARFVPSPTPPVRAAIQGFVPPSESLVLYASDLARKLNVSLTRDQLADKRRLSAFVDHAKTLMSKGIAGVPSSWSNHASDVPTERQLAFAKAIAARRGLAIDAAALGSRAELSRWIDTHKG